MIRKGREWATKAALPAVVLAVVGAACASEPPGGLPEVTSPGSGERLRQAKGDPCKLYTVKELRPLLNVRPSLGPRQILWARDYDFTPFSSLVNPKFCTLIADGQSRFYVALVDTLPKDTFNKFKRSEDTRPVAGLGRQAVASEEGVVVLTEDYIVAVQTKVRGDARARDRAAYLARLALGGK